MWMDGIGRAQSKAAVTELSNSTGNKMVGIWITKGMDPKYSFMRCTHTSNSTRASWLKVPVK